MTRRLESNQCQEFRIAKNADRFFEQESFASPVLPLNYSAMFRHIVGIRDCHNHNFAVGANPLCFFGAETNQGAFGLTLCRTTVSRRAFSAGLRACHLTLVRQGAYVLRPYIGLPVLFPPLAAVRVSGRHLRPALLTLIGGACSPECAVRRHILLNLEDSNLHQQNQNLLCCHYTKVQYVGRAGLEPAVP